jgi:hypothetical protein
MIRRTGGISGGFILNTASGIEAAIVSLYDDDE